MKNYNFRLKSIKMYSGENTPPKFLFLLIHALILFIFFLVLFTSGKSCKSEAGKDPGQKECSLNKMRTFTSELLDAQIQNGILYFTWIGNEKYKKGFYVVESYINNEHSSYIGILSLKKVKNNELYSFAYPIQKNSAYYKIKFFSGGNTYEESENIIPENLN